LRGRGEGESEAFEERSDGERPISSTSDRVFLLGAHHPTPPPLPIRPLSTTPTPTPTTTTTTNTRRRQEASFALATNDPSGFNAIDTLAWGAIGHALGYFALATNSLSAAGFDAKPF
jgi:photosystem I reaction center subunit V